jgi:Leucine-rich repeat (LRR) protein
MLVSPYRSSVMSAPIDCRSRDEWERLLSRPLPPTEADSLAEHLEQCNSCATTVEAVLGNHTIVEALRVRTGTETSQEEVQRIIARFRDASAEATDSFAPASADVTQPGDIVSSHGEPAPFLSPPRGPDEMGWLGTYRVLKKLGEGGMGVVYVAEDSLLHRPVALKVMQPHFAAGKVHRERFLREARSAAAIEHDHIVPIYQVGEANNVPFLAMKLLQGETLEHYMLRGAAMTPAIVARLGRQIALGLVAAHARGLIHRDIKPANVWLEKEPAGRVKLLDFGLARGRDEAHITSQGVIVGTPAYMAPEQARGEDLDGRADLFSLGVLLYRLLTGKQPFVARDAISTLLAVSTVNPPPVRSLNPSVPPALDALVTKLLAKEATRRPASAAEVARMLEAMLKAAPPAPAIAIVTPLPTVVPLRRVADRTVVAAPPRRVPRLVTLLIAGGALTVMLLVAYLTRDGDKPIAATMRQPEDTDRAGGGSAVKSGPASAVDDAWIASVAALPPEAQVEKVANKLKQLNPQFNGRIGTFAAGEIEFTVRDGAVRQIKVPTDNVADISPLRALQQLNSVVCEPTNDKQSAKGQLADLSPLRDLPLRYVSCSANGSLRDLAPLQKMNLDGLYVAGTAIKSVEVVREMPLQHLSVERTQVDDLSPVAGKKLLSLYFRYSNVTDLSPLRGMAITHMSLSRYVAGDAALVRGMPLVDLTIDYSPWRDAELIAGKTLKKINSKPAEEYRAEAADRMKKFEEWCQDVAKMEPAAQVEAVAAKLRELNHEFAGTVTPTIQAERVIGLTFSTTKVADISPVRALMHLQRLNCSATEGWGKVTDLSPLQGLSLRLLYCNNNHVADLDPLRKMPLEDLSMWGYRDRDLTPLKGMPLRRLGCGSSPVVDLTPLAGLPLESLNISQSKVSDLTPLKGMSLRYLHVAKTAVTDLSPLKGMPLDDVNILGTRVTDLSLLAGMPLTTLSLDFKPWRDDELIRKPTLKIINSKPAGEFRKETAATMARFEQWCQDVAKMVPAEQVEAVAAKLKELNPEFSGKVGKSEDDGLEYFLRLGEVAVLRVPTEHVKDISPLRALHGLRHLNLGDAAKEWDGKGQVTDLWPLKGLPLEGLSCAGNLGVTDLTPLAGMKLKALWMHKTGVSDLSVLKDFPLEHLICSGTPVRDLAPLKGKKLTVLGIMWTNVTDLTLLADMPLESLWLDYNPWRDAELIKKPTLKKINEKPVDLFRADVERQRVAFDKWCQDVATMQPEKQVEAVAAKLKELNPEFSGKVAPRGTNKEGALEYHLLLGRLAVLRIPTEHVSDISPVRALPDLRMLFLGESLKEWDGKGRVTDLWALAGLPLERLSCAGNVGVSDLTPLVGMKLNALWIHRTGVTDLSVVKDFPLEVLVCEGRSIRDLSPLKGKKMTGLYINGTSVTDFTVLADMPLEVLALDYNPWRDAELIRKPTLKKINEKPADDFRKEAAVKMAPFEEWRQKVEKLTPQEQVKAVAAKLKDLNPGFSGRIGTIANGEIEFTVDGDTVIELKVPTDEIRYLSPVRALPGLRSLECRPADQWKGSGKLTDLWPLHGLPLRRLECGGNPAISDLTPMAGMPLTGLYFYRTAVADMKVVADMPLIELGCQQTPVRDLSPLIGKKLTHIYCGASQVRDLSPLKGMKLTSAYIELLPSVDPAVLADMPLQSLQLDYDPKRDVELIRKPTLRLINHKPAAEFRKAMGVAEPAP